MDVGTTGEDTGNGGKPVIPPRGYDGPVPADGYMSYQSNIYGVHVALRPVAKNGGTLADQAS